MNIYKCAVVHRIVVSAETEDEAKEAIRTHTFLDGIPSVIGEPIEVKSIDELDCGWTGDALAFSKGERDPNEQSIAYWLKQKGE